MLHGVYCLHCVQAPAANHKETAETMLETFVLSNTSPQVGRGFNRCADRLG